ncbi:hypothetical protein [Porcincola intestinalis]|uniref:hypothetical protein n=1 Tax=Porcincola intestinalis TaxID=2606632 RepID=UPI002A911D8A|nr:hypothetical protein [Porcincola intestinalis]MDY5578399.1 hypothetical protein [Porcincola intestinalis]
MTDFETYMQKSHWLSQYKDPVLKDYVCAFVKEKYEASFGIRRSSAQNAVAHLSRFLQARTLESITATDLVTYISNNKQGSNRILPSFFSFMARKGLFRDTPIVRLHDFEEMIANSAVTSEKLKYLLSLEEADYQAYLASPLYAKRKERYGYAVFFFNIDDSCILANGAASFLDQYVTDYKWSSDDSPTQMIRFLEGINYCASMLFSRAGDIFITADDVFRLLERSKREYKPPTPCQIRVALFQMLDAMLRNGFNLDENAACATRIARNVRLARTELVDEVLSAQHPERYMAYTTASGEHKEEKHCVIINVQSENVRHAMASFLGQYGHTDAGIPVLCRRFEESVENKQITNFQDLSYATYLEQIAFFRDFEEKNVIIAALTAFYLYVQQNHVTDLFGRSGIPDTILQRNDIWRLILDGYTVVVHNPLEPVPEADKWVLCYLPSRNDKTVDIMSLDFTTINGELFRKWVKTYIWHADVMMETKRHPYYVMKEMLNYLYAIKTGDILTVFTKPHIPFDTITANEAGAIRNHVFSVQENTRTRAGYIYNLRNLLRYVADNDLGTVESGVFHTLTYTQDQDYGNAAPIPDEELHLLTAAFRKRLQDDTLAALCYSAAYIILETELRGSTVLELRRDCIRETAKRGEYVIAVEEKTSSGEIVYHPVTQYVVREIREVERLTEEYRQQNTDTNLTNTLFIVPGNKNGVFRRLSGVTLNRYLKVCCEDAGIPSYTVKNLRYTHMTNVMRHKIQRSLSDMEQSVLTGHKSPQTDDIHYVRLDIREMLEATNGIIIGDATVKGSVEQDSGQSFATTNNLVSHDCGYCKSKACNEMSYIDCLVCKDFVTMPSRMPFFKDRIAIIDKQIQAVSVPHDREDLATIKKLLVMYIERILEVMEDHVNATI